MKKTKTQSCKLLITLLYIFLIGITFVSCEAEKDISDSEIQKNIKKEHISFTEFKKNSKVYESYTKFRQTVTSNSSKNLVVDSLTNFVLDMDKILKITQGNYNSYTILIYDPTDDSKVKNLVFSEKSGGDFDIYLAKYALTTEEQKRLDEGEILYLSGKIELYANSKTDLSNPVRIDAAGNCYVIDRIWEEGGMTFFTTINVPCPPGMGNNGGDSDNGSSSNAGTFWTIIPFPTHGSGDNGNDSGGGLSNNNPQMITYPVVDKKDHIKSLNNLTKNKSNGSKTIVKEYIDLFKSELATLRTEDGVHFIKSGNNFIPRPADYRYPDRVSYLPNSLLPHTKVVMHMHEITADVTHINPLTHFPEVVQEHPAPIFSHGDIDKTAEQFQESNYDEDFTSILVSEAGVFALRVNDASELADTNIVLGNDQDASIKFENDFIIKVITASADQSNETYVNNFVSFLNTYIINTHHIGLILFEAVFDEQGNIINWIKK